MANRTLEDATCIDEIFALPGGAGRGELPNEPATWFGLEESLLYALLRATRDVLPDDDDPLDAGPPVAPLRSEDTDELAFAGLGDGLLAALAGLRVGDAGSAGAEMIGDLPAPGVEHPLASLASLVRQLRGVGLGGVELDAHLAATRRLCWTIRLATCLSEDDASVREHRMRFVFDAVGRWLRDLLGERARLLEDAERWMAVPGVSLTLLGIIEQHHALEGGLVAVALLRLAGHLDAPGARRQVARLLLDSPPDARRSRQSLASELGATAADRALAELADAGPAALERGRDLLRDVDVATDAIWAQLLVGVVERLEREARLDEAVELVLAVGDVAATPARALGVLTRGALVGPRRERAAQILAGHGVPGLDEAAAWLANRAAVETARAALESGQPVDALRALRRVGDEDDDAMILAARAYEALGQTERAAARYEQLAARSSSVAPEVYAGLGRSGLASGRRDAAELLELAFQSGHSSAADAGLLVEHYVQSGELVAAERWLEVASELSGGTSQQALHEWLSSAALEQGRAMAASGDVGQAEGLLELAARHAGSLLGRVALARLEVVERARGRSAVLEAASSMDPVTAEAVARAAHATLDAGTPREDAERAVELADALRSGASRAVWPFVLLAASLRQAKQPDGALSAAEGGLMQCSGQIAADEPGGEPAPLSGRLLAQRDDAASLYEVMAEVHRGRGDHAAACQIAARGLAHLGRVERLVDLAGRLLASGDGGEIRTWEMAMVSVLGPAGVGPLVGALRARADGPAAESADVATEHEADSGVVARLLEAIGMEASHVSQGLSQALGDARRDSLERAPAHRAVSIVAAWLSAPPAPMPVARTGRTTSGRGAVVGGGREASPLATSPTSAPAWTVQRIDKASAAFGRSDSSGGDGEGSSS